MQNFKKLLGPISIISIAYLMSRVFGFIREILLARWTGVSSATDTLDLAFVIPDFLFYLSAGGYLAITLIPILSKFQKDKLGKVTEISLFSDVNDSGFLKHGTAFGCKTTYLKTFPTRARIIGNYEANWIKEIDSHKPELLVLAGFMKILSKNFIHFFHSRIINLHPSLLPSFRGLDAIERAFNQGVKITGCTVHWVNDSIDCGQIIDQSPVY